MYHESLYDKGDENATEAIQVNLLLQRSQVRSGEQSMKQRGPVAVYEITVKKAKKGLSPSQKSGSTELFHPPLASLD